MYEVYIACLWSIVNIIGNVRCFLTQLGWRKHIFGGQAINVIIIRAHKIIAGHGLTGLTSLTGCSALVTPNCDYNKEVEASSVSYLNTVALDDSSLMDFKLISIVVVMTVPKKY